MIYWSSSPPNLPWPRPPILQRPACRPPGKWPSRQSPPTGRPRPMEGEQVTSRSTNTSGRTDSGPGSHPGAPDRRAGTWSPSVPAVSRRRPSSAPVKPNTAGNWCSSPYTAPGHRLLNGKDFTFPTCFPLITSKGHRRRHHIL